MKLRTVLNQQTTQRLRRIADNTDLSAGKSVTKAALLDLLCRHLPDPRQVAARVETLSTQQRVFLTELTAEGGEMLKDEAVREFGDGFAPRLRVLLRDLSERGLVFETEDPPLIGIPDPLLKSIPLPPQDHNRLRNIVRSTSIGLLRAFARELGIPIPDPRRPFVVRAIRDHLLNPEHLKSYLNALSEEKQAILGRILDRDAVTRQEIQNTSGTDAGRELEDLLWKTPLFAFDKEKRPRHQVSIRLASDLRKVLQHIAAERGGNLESRPEEALEEPPQPPSETRDNTPGLLQDLATLLGLIEQKRPRILKRGGVPKADLRDARQFCRGAEDPGYPEFLILFAEAAGLIQRQGKFWGLSGSAGEKLKAPAGVRRALFDFWQQTEKWNEWTEDRPASPGRRARMEELKALRREILKALRRCPADRWVAYPKFYRLLTRTSEPFRHLAERPAGGRALAAGGTTADELLRRILRGALAWMGLIALGNPGAFSLPLQRNDKALFRITPGGRALLTGENPDALLDGLPPTNPEARFILQPNLEILSPPDLPPPVYIRLFSLADVAAIDVMTRFRVTRDTIRRALSRDRSAGDLRAFLNAHSATALPDILDALIRECENKLGEIEIATAAGYITAVRPELLDELYAQKRVAACLGARLSPVSAVLRPNVKPETLLQTLQTRGYMPSLAQDLAEARDGYHQVILRSSELSGLVAFLEKAVSAYHSHTTGSAEEIETLLKRLRHSLRDASNHHRREAEARYDRSFDGLPAPQNEGPAQDPVPYPGTNPATGPADIRAMIGFAIDHRMCIEIDYGADDPGKDGPRVVEPVSEDHAMLYAFCRSRNDDRVFRLDRIRSARLTGDRTDRAVK